MRYLADIVIIAILATTIFLILRSQIKKYRKGQCSGGCSGCTGNCCGCQIEPMNTEKK